MFLNWCMQVYLYLLITYIVYLYREIKLVSKTKHDKHMWISMLQAQNPKLLCRPSTTTHSFRQAIEKCHSFTSINSCTSGVNDEMTYAPEVNVNDGYASGDNDGLTFKVESHHFLSAPHLYRSMSASYKQRPQVSSIQRSVSQLTES